MMKRTFLKLEGLLGPSYAPRHIGDFEVSSFTFSNKPIFRRNQKGCPGRTSTICWFTKGTTRHLRRLDWHRQRARHFATGGLIVEEVIWSALFGLVCQKLNFIGEFSPALNATTLPGGLSVPILILQYVHHSITRLIANLERS
jgi:hypothetical protein